MPLLPADPFSLIGIVLVAATVALLVASDWPKAYLIGASTIVLFALQFLHQMVTGTPLGLFRLALSPEGLLSGEWWTLVTYAFVHGGFLHIVGNLFILLTAGPALEESVGPGWFLAIYAAGAVVAAGAGVGLAYLPVADPAIALPTKTLPMVGSSGAIFAVLTAFAVRHPREKLPLPFYIILWLPSMVVLLAFLAMNVGYIFVESNVAWYGHFGGFLAGLFVASLPVEFGETTSRARVDVEDLEHLARNDRSREALDQLRSIDDDETDVAKAWIDELAEANTCPVCESQLARDGLDVVCPRGHDPTEPPD